MKLSTSRTTLCLIVITSLLAIGCTSKSAKKFTLEKNEAELYNSAQQQIKRNNYEEAIGSLQTMEKKFPFGEYSKAAQLSLIYAYFGFEEPESASATADRFIRLHPQHRNVDYAYYMKGLISFPEAKTFSQRLFKVDLSKRDFSEARASFNHFANLTKRFPKSEYTPDALKRMEHLRNLLARHEIHVANYYLEREAFIAAANRGRYVVENFQRTPAVPDALAVMAQGYHEMNIDDLAEKSIQTLKANYPNHPALNKDGSFNFDYYARTSRSWLGILTFGLFNSPKTLGFNSEVQYQQLAP
jgi:outer membrane protein assembly factor BamD